MKNLPIAIQTLSKLMANNCVYVDKTEFAWLMVQRSGAFFLSRPRRFGKSLFVDTLKEIFEGNSVLFEGLYIHDKWDWTQKFPVIKIDFSDGTLQSREELDKRIYNILNDNGRYLDIKLSTGKDIPGTFGELIRKAKDKYAAPVVVLVDEYDKPILDNIDRPDVAIMMREGLKNLYSVLKGQDAHLQFVFMTGVSKFSRVSLFSGINQLEDITLDARYSAICGYTQKDIESCLGEYMEGVEWEKLQYWYNGYKWIGDISVYNPYDILLFISKGRSYRNYWFETGSPNFLIKLFKKNRYFLPDLANIESTEEILDSFDVENINPLTLLFQTGYLTIDRTFTRRQRLMFALRIPNFEVKISLNDQFINGYTELLNEKIGIQNNLYSCLDKGDMEGVVGVIKRLFAKIPYRNFTSNRLTDVEGYYASVLYAFFSSLDAQIIPEDVTNHGQVDMTVKIGNNIYVMEIKVIDSSDIDHNPALEQIQRMQYAQKYQGEHGKSVHEVGLVFSSIERNLVKADWNNQSITKNHP